MSYLQYFKQNNSEISSKLEEDTIKGTCNTMCPKEEIEMLLKNILFLSNELEKIYIYSLQLFLLGGRGRT